MHQFSQPRLEKNEVQSSLIHICYYNTWEQTLKPHVSRRKSKGEQFSYIIKLDFYQAELLYVKFNILLQWQVLNIDEPGYTPGSDLNKKDTERVVTNTGHRAAWSKLDIRYEYCTSSLLFVGADGTD